MHEILNKLISVSIIPASKDKLLMSVLWSGSSETIPSSLSTTPFSIPMDNYKQSVQQIRGGRRGEGGGGRGKEYSVASLTCDSSLIKLIPVTRRTCNWLLPLFLNAESLKASHTIEQYTIFPLQFCYLSMYVPGLGDVPLD